MTLQVDIQEIRNTLQVIVGLPLRITRLAADMRGFHFGTITEDEKGSYGEYALHVQCSWRLEGPNGIITGYQDLWEPKNEEDWDENWCYYKQENLQDAKIKEWMGGYDERTRSPINTGDRLFVELVHVFPSGDLFIRLSGGYNIVTFMNSSRDEAWRFFKPESDEDHLVFPLEE